jgi:cytochrome oxidase Cu insertion factor (SCO1/SenC/PrrC family)
MDVMSASKLRRTGNVLAFAIVVLFGGLHAQSASPPGRSAEEASSLADIGPAPDVALTDCKQRPFELASLRGKAVLVSFIYTTCNGSCPATTHSLYRVQEALKTAGLWGKRAELVSITLDPSRDTPEVLSNYARLYSVDLAAWHFLTGASEQVSKVIASWGMWAKIGPSGVLDHPSRIFLVDPQGRIREIYNLEFLAPATVLQDVRTVLDETTTP